jgi:ATP-dependent DNA ligase
LAHDRSRSRASARAPAVGVFDGELFAFREGQPWFPDVCRRLLHRDAAVPVTFVAFDVLEHEGEDVTGWPYRERRALLASLALCGER